MVRSMNKQEGPMNITDCPKLPLEMFQKTFLHLKTLSLIYTHIPNSKSFLMQLNKQIKNILQKKLSIMIAQHCNVNIWEAETGDCCEFEDSLSYLPSLRPA